MEAMYLGDIVKAVDGRICADHMEESTGGIVKSMDDIEKIVINVLDTDSRNITEGSLFVPIRGEKFDGHEYIGKALESGAAACFTDRYPDEYKEGKYYVQVEDTKKAFACLAKYYKSKFDVKCVAITGSVGKTTTKDMIFSVLKEKFNVLKTEGNFNNDIGLPKTIFNLNKDHEIIILEMGMNHAGEIDFLGSIAEPEIGIITNIGISHIENLGSRENILKAKAELLPHIAHGGLAILNRDDDMLNKKLNMPERKLNVLWYGMDMGNCDAYADHMVPDGISGVSLNINTKENKFNAYIHSAGKHMAYAALIAALTGEEFGMSANEIKAGIESFYPSNMRMSIEKLNHHIILIDDAYNASPQSMKSGIDVLKSGKSKYSMTIFGDMFELGKYSESAHREVGKYAAETGIDFIIAIGNDAKYIYEEAKKTYDEQEDDKVFFFEDKEDFIKEIGHMIVPDTAILVKASRGMHFEKIAESIKSFFDFP